MSGSTQTEGGALTTTTPLRSGTLHSAAEIDAAMFPDEARLLDALSTATDLSSSSDEVEAACATWFDRHHLSSARANTLRAIDISARSTVLEIAPGGGAVTRYLGETCTTVDAVESDPRLATIAARRCDDLPSVQVHVGWIDDVPVEPVYDLVVALDVMGDLRHHDTALETFVQQCAALLAPGGLLVLGADNVDGVRFVAGDAPPLARHGQVERPAQWHRDDLEKAVRSAGLSPAVLSAFPDHRSARTVFDHDALAGLAPDLLTALPGFPSPSYDGPRPAGFSEASLWSQAVARGEGARSANSFVVIAATEPPAPASAATYWSMGRRAAFSATNTVIADAGTGPLIRREPTFPDAPRAEGPLHLRPHSEPLLDGTGLTGVLAAATDPVRVALLLREWSDLVDRSVVEGEPVCWDLIPRNVLIGEAHGGLEPFDQEWQLDARPGGADLVRARGAFWLAYDLMVARCRPDWLRGRTVGEAADYILRLARPDTPFDWFDTFVDLESTLMSHIWPSSPRHSRQARARKEWNSVSSLSNTTPPEQPGAGTHDDPGTSLRDVIDSLTAANADLRAEVQALRLEQRRTALVHRDHAVGLAAETEALREKLARVKRESRRHKDRALLLQEQVAAMKKSTTWRVGSRVVKPLASIGRKSRS